MVVGHSPAFQILFQIEVRMSVMASPPAWAKSAGMLSTPADFPIIGALNYHKICTCAVEECIQIMLTE